MSSPPPTQTQRSQTPAVGAAERRRQLAETRRLREEAMKKAEEERLRAEEEERREEEELARIEEEERLAKERAEREKEEREREAAERRRLKEEKEKAAARAKEKGKGRAEPQDESMAGSSRAASEGSSRKRAREEDEGEDEEEEAMVVKKPRKKRGPTITIRPQLAMGGERKCQRCHDLGLDCVVAKPKGNITTRSCGPCYEHKKKCQPMMKPLNQPLLDINESAMKALIGTIDNLVAIADQSYFRLERTLDLVDEYLLWKMGRSSGSSSRRTAEDDEEEED